MVPMFTSVAYGPGFYCVHFSPSSTLYILSGKTQARFTLLRVLLGDSSKLPFISPTNQFQTLRTTRLVLSQWFCFFIPNFCIANNHVSGAACSEEEGAYFGAQYGYSLRQLIPHGHDHSPEAEGDELGLALFSHFIQSSSQGGSSHLS